MKPHAFRLLALGAFASLVFSVGWLASNRSHRKAAPPSPSLTAQPSALPFPQTPPAPDKATREPPVLDLSQMAAHANTPEGRKTLTAHLREWARVDGAAATSWIEDNLQGNLRRNTLYNALAAWAESTTDESAADFVLSLRSDPVYDMAVQGLIHGWAKSNPAAAAAWITARAPAGDETENAAGLLARTWAETNPSDAAQWAVEYFDTSGSGLAFQRAIASWAVEDLNAASAFVNKAPLDLQFQGYMQISMAWAKLDAPAAAEWANGLESSRLRHGALAHIIETWSRQTPKQAAAFVTRIDNEEARATSARFLIGNWIESDMVAASTWLGALPQGAVRDEAVAELGNRLLDRDPERALTWSLEIRDTILRDGQIEDLLHSWLLRDETTARAWMASHEIPLELLATLEGNLE